VAPASRLVTFSCGSCIHVDLSASRRKEGTAACIWALRLFWKEHGRSPASGITFRWDHTRKLQCCHHVSGACPPGTDSEGYLPYLPIDITTYSRLTTTCPAATGPPRLYPRAFTATHTAQLHFAHTCSRACCGARARTSTRVARLLTTIQGSALLSKATAHYAVGVHGQPTWRGHKGAAHTGRNSSPKEEGKILTRAAFCSDSTYQFAIPPGRSGHCRGRYTCYNRYYFTNVLVVGIWTGGPHNLVEPSSARTIMVVRLGGSLLWRGASPTTTRCT